MRKDVEVVYRNLVDILVNVEIEAEHKVLNYEKVGQYLTNAENIFLMDCSCKTKRGHCVDPKEICIRIKGDPEHILNSEDYKHLHPRMVGLDEALSVLEKTHKAGLVHMALVKKNN